jgi:serine phosphatase RsbU (regulator of sigma subunit)
MTDERLDLRSLLDAVEASPPLDAVDVVGRELGRMLDATEVSLLIANFSGSAVVRMSRITAAAAEARAGRNERAEQLPLAGSPYGEVLASQEMRLLRHGSGWLALVPVTERGDAIGILELSLPQHPDNETARYLASAAHALAYILVASRRHTDLFEWAQRDTPFSLAAEIQRRLLPSSYTVEGGPFTIAGWLEPAAEVGGDTFDYSIDREFLYASITDAMGHSVEAALLATVAVGSLRNTRRRIATPAEQAAAANDALLASARRDQYVTGHLLRIRLADGMVEVVNAGHPAPYLLRDGVATPIDLPPGMPLGVDDAAYTAQTFELRAGDRLLLVTDGFLERTAVKISIEAALEDSVGQHPRQVVRGLSQLVLDATGGELRDDATVLCIDWFGGAGARGATAGASRSRTTSI